MWATHPAEQCPSLALRTPITGGGGILCRRAVGMGSWVYRRGQPGEAAPGRNPAVPAESLLHATPGPRQSGSRLLITVAPQSGDRPGHWSSPHTGSRACRLRALRARQAETSGMSLRDSKLGPVSKGEGKGRVGCCRPQRVARAGQGLLAGLALVPEDPQRL